MFSWLHYQLAGNRILRGCGWEGLLNSFGGLKRIRPSSRMSARSGQRHRERAWTVVVASRSRFQCFSGNEVIQGAPSYEGWKRRCDSGHRIATARTVMRPGRIKVALVPGRYAGRPRASEEAGAESVDWDEAEESSPSADFPPCTNPRLSRSKTSFDLSSQKDPAERRDLAGCARK